jgi:pimeloyl-ACP methyl ester carboxylesterase
VKQEPVITDCVEWTWNGQPVQVGLDWLSKGRTVLLLPALSSISTRREMRPLQERLASDFATVAVDWPGFGDKPRPRIAWTPSAYAAFLRHVLATVAPGPFATVAAGHAAGYALQVAADMPRFTGRLCLIAPTWRGPLPTMLEGRRRVGHWVVSAGDLPLLGHLLYKLNVNAPVVRMMARGHVYGDPNWLTGKRFAEKMAIVSSPGARYASIRFVSGKLDPMRDRACFVEAARRVNEPILIVYGAATPRKSKAEMEALAAVPHVRSVELPRGKLAIHEEYADEVAEAVRSFLGASTTVDGR